MRHMDGNLYINQLLHHGWIVQSSKRKLTTKKHELFSQKNNSPHGEEKPSKETGKTNGLLLFFEDSQTHSAKLVFFFGLGFFATMKSFCSREEFLNALPSLAESPTLSLAGCDDLGVVDMRDFPFERFEMIACSADQLLLPDCVRYVRIEHTSFTQILNLSGLTLIELEVSLVRTPILLLPENTNEMENLRLCGHPGFPAQFQNFHSFATAPFPKLESAHFSLMNHVPTLDAPILDIFFGDSSLTMDVQPCVKTLFYISAKPCATCFDVVFPNLRNFILHVNYPLASWRLPETLAALCVRVTHELGFPGFDVLELPPSLKLLSVCGMSNADWSLQQSIKPIQVDHFFMDSREDAFYEQHPNLVASRMFNRRDTMLEMMNVRSHWLIWM